MSGWPIIRVTSGGIPVTESTRGVPYTESPNGLGTPVTFVAGGGIPLQGASGPPRLPILGLLTDGDSITDGYNFTDEISWPMYFQAVTGIDTLNQAQAGYQLNPTSGTSTINEYPTQTAPYYNAATRNTLWIMEGTNDIRGGGRTLANLQTDIQTYCALGRATGYQMVVGTIIPGPNWNGTDDAVRLAFNAWLRANYRAFASWLVDCANISVFNPPVIGTYFYDGLHPTSRGNQYIAVLVAQTLGLTLIPQSNAALPSISGAVQTGNVLTGSDGSWTNYIDPAYTYQWLKDGVAISGATSNTYTVVSGDVGHSITYRVRNTSLYAVVDATSLPAAASGTNLAPTMAAAVTLASQNGMPAGTVLGLVAATNAAFPQPVYTIDNASIVSVDSGTGKIIYSGTPITNNGGTVSTPITVIITATNSQGSASTTVTIEKWGLYQFVASGDGTLAADGITTMTSYAENGSAIGQTRVLRNIPAPATITFYCEVLKRTSGRNYFLMGMRNGGNTRRVQVVVDLTTRAVNQAQALGVTITSATAVDLGSGRIGITVVAAWTTDTQIYYEAHPTPTNNTTAFTTSTSEGVYVAKQLATAV